MSKQPGPSLLRSRAGHIDNSITLWIILILALIAIPRFLQLSTGQSLTSLWAGLPDEVRRFLITAPLLLVGAWVKRRSLDFAPWYVYIVALFAFTALVSAVHVPYGTFVHSAVALLPHAYLLVMVGVAAVVHWIAARRSNWDAERATRNLGFMLVGVIAVISVLATRNTLATWSEERDARQEVLSALAEEAAPDDVIMSSDAGAYQYHGDWSGIITPDDPLPTIEQALRLYGVRWLALEGAHTVAALRPVMRGEVRPGWLSEPIVLTPPRPRTPEEIAEDPEAERLPRAALFAVCLGPDDRRCGT